VYTARHLAAALSDTLLIMPILSRRRFCGGASAFLALPAFAAGDGRGILVTAAQAAKLRNGPAPAAIRENVAAARKSGPWSVERGTHKGLVEEAI
jgi:hypothetical protein